MGIIKNAFLRKGVPAGLNTAAALILQQHKVQILAEHEQLLSDLRAKNQGALLEKRHELEAGPRREIGAAMAAGRSGKVAL